MPKALFDVVLPSAELASVYGLAVLAVVVAFRISNFADLTIDGSFTLGGVVGGLALVHGLSIPQTLVLAPLAGAVAGACTALLHTRIGVNRLLAGIITMTVLYSVNLRLMGRPNLSLLDQSGAFDLVRPGPARVAAGVAFAVAVGAALWAFLRTDLGHFMRAAGENARVVTRRGYPEELFLLVSLPLANALAALGGGLAAQQQGFADVGMGTGLVIACLSALLLGEAIVPPRSIPRLIAAALVGMFTYQVLVGIGLRLGLNPWDLKLATGLLLVVTLVLKRYLRTRRAAANIGCDPL